MKLVAATDLLAASTSVGDGGSSATLGSQALPAVGDIPVADDGAALGDLDLVDDVEAMMDQLDVEEAGDGGTGDAVVPPSDVLPDAEAQAVCLGNDWMDRVKVLEQYMSTGKSGMTA